MSVTGPEPRGHDVLDNEQAPDGYRFEWVLSSSIRSGGEWQLSDRPMFCRYGTGNGHTACRRPTVARVNRSANPARRQNWWHYCERHLYGQRIVAGVLVRRILRALDQPGHDNNRPPVTAPAGTFRLTMACNTAHANNE